MVLDGWGGERRRRPARRRKRFVSLGGASLRLAGKGSVGANATQYGGGMHVGVLCLRLQAASSLDHHF